jgi:hypothetical protein
MTEKEILAMRPGPELNIKVAREIMDHKVIHDEHLGFMERLVNPVDKSSIFGLVQKYSEDRDLAELVVDRMLEKGFEDARYWADFGDGAFTEAEAICKAALCAVLKKRESDIADRILREAFGDEYED